MRGLLLAFGVAYLLDKKTGLISDYLKKNGIAWSNLSGGSASNAGIDDWFSGVGINAGINQWFSQGVAQVTDKTESIADQIAAAITGSVPAASQSVPVKVPVVPAVVTNAVDAIKEAASEPVKVIREAAAAVSQSVSYSTVDDLLELIAKGEGTTDAQARAKGYDNGFQVTLAYGLLVDDKSVKIDRMSLGDLDQLQTDMLNNPANKWNSSAAGKYQIVRTTLRKLKSNLGLSDAVIYSASIQRKMAVSLLEGRGLTKFKRGEMSLTAFQTELSKEWASIADPLTGRSYYPPNKAPQFRGAAHTSTADIQRILKQLV